LLFERVVDVAGLHRRHVRRLVAVAAGLLNKRPDTRRQASSGELIFVF
jgi:hypothetical protein